MVGFESLHAENPQLRAWDRRHFWHGFTQMAEYEPFIVREAEGCRIIDIEGREYLDGVSSLWCNVHGHRHPRLDAALRDQLDRVAHVTSLGMGCDTTIRLAHRLAEIAPGDLDHVFFSDDGSTAVEAALKMALQFWRQSSPARPRKCKYLTFREGYHGDSIGSVSLGGIDRFHEVFGPLLFEPIRLPAPDTYRLPPGVTRETALDHYLAIVENALATHHEDLAAIVMEPLVQGAGGMIMHPDGFLAGVRSLATRYNVLLVLDEVAVGFGRTGRMFACEQEHVVPDILCLAKGLTAGYLPMAATIANERVWSAFLGAYAQSRTFYHGHTYGGNPLAAAVALASLDLFAEERLLESLQPKIEHLARSTASLAELAAVGSVRQRGMIVAVELVQDRVTQAPYPWEEQRGLRACQFARERGVWLRPLGNVIILMPPLAIRLTEIDQIVAAARYGIEKATLSA